MCWQVFVLASLSIVDLSQVIHNPLVRVPANVFNK